YRRGDQWKKLVAVVEAQVVLIDDTDERVRLLSEVGALHETRGGDATLAYRAWARAFALDPEAPGVRAELDRLAEQLQNWDEHVGSYELALGDAEDPELMADLLRAIAQLHDTKRGDPRSSIEVY